MAHYRLLPLIFLALAAGCGDSAPSAPGEDFAHPILPDATLPDIYRAWDTMVDPGQDGHSLDLPAAHDGQEAMDAAEDLAADGPVHDGPHDSGTSDDGPPADGGSSGPWSGSLCSVVGEGESEFWERIEVLKLHTPSQDPALYLDDVRQLEREVVEAFGQDQPDQDRLLLHVRAPISARLPVVLVHGAASDGNRSFVKPMGGETGLAPLLADEMLQVFAVTFPHPHGDILAQADLLACAIERIRAMLFASPMVRLVAHSMGCLAARAYVSSAGGEGSTPYQGDVYQLIMLGPPNRGTDYAFRHPNASLFEYSLGLGIPSAWDQVLDPLQGGWQDVTAESIYGGAYPGQLQMLWRWDETYHLSKIEQDWYTTYHGGQGFMSHSLGIDGAMDQGGRFMERLEAVGVDPGVLVNILAGTDPWFGLVAGELTGPSDGLVFEESALYTEGLAQAGAEVTAESLRLNHWDMLWTGIAKDWVKGKMGL